MKILISPAKKMRSDPDTLAPEALPALLSETERLLSALRAMTPGELQALWRCSDTIAAQNLERLRDMDLRRRLTPALLSYVGLQYQYMAPGVLEQRQYDYLQAHLRILSGFYGVLRPFDGVTPYRLEMGAKLETDGARDLYGFWGDKLARVLEPGDGPVVDLASQEYSRAVELGAPCKMARGQLVRWLADQAVTREEELREFRDLGYRFSPERSDPGRYVFLKEDDT